MPDSKPTEQSAAPKPAPPKNEPTARDGGDSIADATKAAHSARTIVPGREGVDARLDNRTPEALEQRTFGPDDAKPQQVDGPDVAGQIEHTRSVLAKRSKKA
jgi:hypothetical protein